MGQFFSWVKSNEKELLTILENLARKAVEASGKKALLLSSNSLSHRHFTVEPEVPEDMSKEHVTNHNQYLWDMKMINLMREGKTKEMIDLMPDFTEQTVAETEEAPAEEEEMYQNSLEHDRNSIEDIIS